MGCSWAWLVTAVSAASLSGRAHGPVKHGRKWVWAVQHLISQDAALANRRQQEVVGQEIQPPNPLMILHHQAHTSHLGRAHHPHLHNCTCANAL